MPAAVAIIRETVRRATAIKRKLATLPERRDYTKMVGRRYKSPGSLSSALEAASSSGQNLTVKPHRLSMKPVGDGSAQSGGGTDQVCEVCARGRDVLRGRCTSLWRFRAATRLSEGGRVGIHGGLSCT